MNNSVAAFNPCGIEVSARTLLVALSCEGCAASLREFPNTPEGHQAVLRFLERSARPVRVAMESTGLYGLDLALCLQEARAAQEFILADRELARRYELLLSIPGFGATSAVHILAELTLLPADMDVRQWVAYAGLDPREYTSGTSVHKKVRIAKAGNKHLRRALYMPALVAVQHQPHVRAYYEYLVTRGKTKMQALVATMRKLLHAI